MLLTRSGARMMLGALPGAMGGFGSTCVFIGIMLFDGTIDAKGPGNWFAF